MHGWIDQSQTLANALADAPDFHVDLGDTFMTEKHASRESAARQYVAQRYYFGLISHSAPLYLVRWTPETGPGNKVELNPYLLGCVHGQKAEAA